MPAPRINRSSDAVGRLKRQIMNLGADMRAARVALGWTQARAASVSGVGQTTVCRLEAGDVRLGMDLVARILGAVGLDLSVKSFPGRGVRLRDSGQLSMAAAIRAEANQASRVTLEEPTGSEHGQAADMVIFSAGRGVHLELESGLADFQAQLRSGHLKRAALEHRYGQAFAFVLVLLDTDRNRRAVEAHRDVIVATLPAGSREVWSAIRSGEALARDGLLWLRLRPAVATSSTHPWKGVNPHESRNLSSRAAGDSLIDQMPREEPVARAGNPT